MSDTTTTPESEGSGEPIPTTPTRASTGGFAVEPLLVPPPLSPQQVQDVIDAINAAKKAVQSVGALAWPLVKWWFGKAIEGLRAIPTAPLTPPLGTQPSTTPPSTTP